MLSDPCRPANQRMQRGPSKAAAGQAYASMLLFGMLLACLHTAQEGRSHTLVIAPPPSGHHTHTPSVRCVTRALQHGGCRPACGPASWPAWLLLLLGGYSAGGMECGARGGGGEGLRQCMALHRGWVPVAAPAMRCCGWSAGEVGTQGGGGMHGPCARKAMQWAAHPCISRPGGACPCAGAVGPSNGACRRPGALRHSTFPNHWRLVATRHTHELPRPSITLELARNAGRSHNCLCHSDPRPAPGCTKHTSNLFPHASQLNPELGGPSTHRTGGEGRRQFSAWGSGTWLQLAHPT